MLIINVGSRATGDTHWFSNQGMIFEVRYVCVCVHMCVKVQIRVVSCKFLNGRHFYQCVL